MKNRRSRFQLWAFQVLFLLCLPSSTLAEKPSFEGSLSLASDYVYRGISQTLGDPAVQPGLDVSWEDLSWGDLSFFLWGANVDFGDDLAEHELDIGISWSRDLSDSVFLSLSVGHYVYFGDREADYSEFGAALEVGSLSFGLTYAPEYFGTPVEASYFEVSYGLELPRSFELTFHLGYSAFDGDPDLAMEEYFDYSVSLGRSWEHVILDLTLGSTDLDEDPGSDSQADTRWVATVTFPF